MRRAQPRSRALRKMPSPTFARIRHSCTSTRRLGDVSCPADPVQLVPAPDPSGGGEEQRQQLHLAGRQVERRPVAAGFVDVEVHGEPGRLDVHGHRHACVGGPGPERIGDGRRLPVGHRRDRRQHPGSSRLAALRCRVHIPDPRQP